MRMISKQNRHILIVDQRHHNRSACFIGKKSAVAAAKVIKITVAVFDKKKKNRMLIVET